MTEGGDLSITIQAIPRGVALVVRDSGVGMDDETLAQCCDPMFSTKDGEGAGLGLTICRDIVKQLGGELDLQSEEGLGTTVTVSLSTSEQGHPC